MILVFHVILQDHVSKGLSNRIWREFEKSSRQNRGIGGGGERSGGGGVLGTYIQISMTCEYREYKIIKM